METVRKINIKSNTDTYQWVVSDDESEDAQFSQISDVTSERMAELAKKWGVTPEFILEIGSELASLRSNVHEDLVDIWDRLDRMERGK